jgi:hypothetical protein
VQPDKWALLVILDYKVILVTPVIPVQQDKRVILVQQDIPVKKVILVIQDKPVLLAIKVIQVTLVIQEQSDL